jgi:two-component system OmpR family response regulator
MKLLVVEDDAETAAYIVTGLSEHGHVVDHARNGREGLFLAGSGGLSLVKTLRGGGVGTAVLFLTNLGGIDDRVEGLDAGGDDYLVKPFAFAELLARVNALGRRPAMNTVETVLQVADLEMNLLTRSVTRGGKAIDLQPREFKLLECLMHNAGRVVTRTMLLEKVWDFHFDPKTNIVETHMSRLRAKVDRGFASELIHTVRGAGYSLRAPG